jgi:hypothetical protein
MGTLNINQCVNGTVTQLASTSISVSNGMTLRTVIFGTSLWVYDGTNTLIAMQTVPLTTGSPGIGGYGQYGLYAPSGFLSVAIGHHDTLAPDQVVASTVATSPTPNAAWIKWQGALDDLNGVGVFGSYVTRSGQQPVFVASSEFTESFPTIRREQASLCR